MALDVLLICTLSCIQVSLAIRGGYDPDKFQTANTKFGSLGLNLAYKWQFSLVIHEF